MIYKFKRGAVIGVRAMTFGLLSRRTAPILGQTERFAMKNAYKNLSIFKCIHEAHHSFNSRMSVHHILNRKGCFPNGCFYFKWDCKLMKQGKKCYRGYNYMGKNCSGCRYFSEEKVHNHPELQVGEVEYGDFLSELDLFDDWVQEQEHREMEIHGTVDGVKPLFMKKLYSKGEAFSFTGFLLIFKSLYFERTLMEDHVYVRLSPKTYRSLQFGRGDVLTARATLKVDEGRLVLQRLRKVEIEARGEAAIWDESKALVARETATEMPGQPEGCMQCPFGALVDVSDQRNREERRYRRLFCLQGVKDYRICPIYPGYAGQEEATQKVPANAASCTRQRVNVAPKISSHSARK